MWKLVKWNTAYCYLLGLALLVPAVAVKADTDVVAVGNTSNRTIHLIEVATGQIRQTVGVHGAVSGIAADDDGQVFYYTDQSRLYSVPYNGGASTEIGIFSGDSTVIYGLAYDMASGTLYGCFNTGIFEVDPLTAQTMLLLNPSGNNFISGIDIDSTTGEIYVCDDDGSAVAGPGIYRVNLDTGAYTGVHNPYPGGATDVDGFAIRDGIGYLIEDNDNPGEWIREIRMSDGVVTRTFAPPYADGSFNSAGAFATIEDRTIPIAGTEVSELGILDTTMRDFMRLNDIGGASLAVMRNGTTVYHRAFGWQDADRLVSLNTDATMRIASVTKPLTAAAIRHLISQGQLSLSDFVFDNGSNNGVLDLTPFGTPDSRIYFITIEHLLQHYGGWDRGIAGDHTYRESQIANEMGIASPPGREATVQWIMGQPLQYNPGSTYAYSNIGYLLLGLVVEEMTGTAHMNYVQQEVFAPLGVPASQVFGGSTFVDAQDPREPWYNGNGYESSNVFFPTYNSSPIVQTPYGGWDHEARIGQGSMVANPLGLLAFLDEHQVAGNGIGGPRPAPGSWRWNHTGSLTGTNTLARQRGDGINYVVLFNKRPTYGSSYSSQIRSLLDPVLDGISNWPTDDVTRFFTDRYELNRGVYFSGGLADLATSDNSDLSFRRSATDVNGWIHIEFFKTSPVSNPTKLQFTLESAVFARSTVVQILEVFDFDSNQWQILETQNASRFVDSLSTASISGDLAKYVNDANGEIRIRCRYESVSRRQNFSANLDYADWEIE